jgi:hypothetical protein
MTAPYQRKRDWTAALQRRVTRSHFIKAGMLPPAFFFCANTEDHLRGEVWDVISNTKATLVGSVGFGYNHQPNFYGRVAPSVSLPVLTLPQGAGLSFASIPELVASTNSPVIISTAVKLNGVNRANTGGPQIIYRTLVSRVFRNPGGTGTNYSGWSVSGSDYKSYAYETTYSTRTHVRRAKTLTSYDNIVLNSPFTTSIARPHTPGSMMAWSIELGKVSNTTSSVISGNPDAGYPWTTVGSNFILGDTNDRPLLVGCGRDVNTDTFYDSFLDGEMMFMAIWSGDNGAMARTASFVGYANRYGAYMNDPMEMFRRLALAMDEGGGTRPFFVPSTYYVSDAEAGDYPMFDPSAGSMPTGTRLFANRTLVELIAPYPLASGTYLGSSNAGLRAGMPCTISVESHLMAVRGVPRGSEAAPACAASGLPTVGGDTVIYKDTHTFKDVEYLRGAYSNEPLNVFMPNASPVSATIRTSGFVSLTGGTSSPKTLNLQQLNGKLVGHSLGLGGCVRSSLWSSGITDLFDCAMKPTFYWSFTTIDPATMPIGNDSLDDLTYPTRSPSLPDVFGVSNTESRRSLRMYGGVTYGSAGEVGPGSLGSVIRMYGVNSIRRPAIGNSSNGLQVIMPVAASMYSSPSKVVRIGGMSAMPAANPGPFTFAGGTGAKHDPSFIYGDNLTPQGSLPHISTDNGTIAGPTTSVYRVASPARRAGVPYSWLLNRNNLLKDHLFYTPLRTRFLSATAGTAVRIHIAGLDNTTVATLTIRVLYTKNTGLRGSSFARGTEIVLNSISNTLWEGGVPLAAYTDIACPGLVAGYVEAIVGLVHESGVQPTVYIDPYIGVV